MKVILAGYEGSKKIIPASAYLLRKYLSGFDAYFLNYGGIWFQLLEARYVSMAQKQEGGADAWAKYIAGYLQSINDELIIFGLDDYLVSDYINQRIYDMLLGRISNDKNVVCARLCTSVFYNNIEDLGHDMIMLGRVQYSVTTQYCIWRREYLVDLLGKVTSAWDFELRGSQILNDSDKRVIGMKQAVIPYLDCSSLSPKWGNKIKITGVKNEDIDTLIQAGILNRDDLIG